MIADQKGRRPGILISTFITAIALIVCGLAPNFWVWIVALCVAGFGLGGLETISMVYVSEISATNFRNNAQVILITVWGGAQIVMGLVFNLVKYWRWMFLWIMGTPFLFCFIFAYYWMDETPRYLNSNNKYKEAKRVIRKMCRFNKRPPFQFKLHGEIKWDNEKFFVVAPDCSVSIGGHSFLGTSAIHDHSQAHILTDNKLGLFSSQKYKYQTVIMFLLWGIRFFVYFGLQFQMEDFGDDHAA